MQILKKVLSATLKTFAVIFAMMLSFMIATGISNPQATAQSAAQSPEEAAQAGLTLLIVSIINALILTYPIARSRWHGLKLIAAIIIVFFGTQTIMSQVETVFFGSAFNIPAEEMKTIVMTGFLTSVFFSLLAVLIMEKMRKPKIQEISSFKLDFSRKDWIKRLAFLPIVYMALYFLFGYFIAWQSPDVRLLYTGSTNIQTFSDHMIEVMQSSPEIFPFQYMRGLIWIALALPVIHLMKTKTWEKSIALGLLFGLLITTQLLFRNPYMPEPVRLAHFIETSTSTFIYGWLIGQVFASSEEKRNTH